ncbi:hypothetical protein [Companilactobacillus sp. HBUAS59699]|uniref:hypothetical protein n=1 Tax=Companilactobacillus sp. HBUAS59699 TaxID=3109358 RepID=UPI002FF3DD97
MKSVAKVVLMRWFSAFTELDDFIDLRSLQSKKAKVETAFWLELVPPLMELLLTGSGKRHPNLNSKN